MAFGGRFGFLLFVAREFGQGCFFLQRGLGTDGNECRIRLCELLSNAVVRVKLKAKNIVN